MAFQIIEVTKDVTLLSGKTTKELKIINKTDDNFNQKVTAQIWGLGAVVLWEGETYTAIGQWTDADIKERLEQLYNV